MVKNYICFVTYFRYQILSIICCYIYAFVAHAFSSCYAHAFSCEDINH